MSDILSFLPNIQGNILDLVILAIIAFYAYEGYLLGLVAAIIDLLSFFLSFIIALKFYSVISPFIASSFSLSTGFAHAISFFVIALVSEILLNLLFRKVLVRLPMLSPDNLFANTSKRLNHVLGIVPGVASAFIILSFLLTLVIALPSSPFLKEVVNTSYVGSRLVANAAVFENRLNDIFGGALHETLNFITIEPQSSERINLRFKVASPTVDTESEQQMWRVINSERQKRGLSVLTFDTALRDAARDYSRDMFERGYFSHYTPEGESPFMRMENAGIEYLSAGENLALAPSVELAMQGLMDSPGHRANILSENFGKIGIGVMDGGIYGKMFTQEFTD
ncbi:MAG: CvpA family protein [Candidatus Levybacteria bacterium]|nr:CvpA family protein [Candidatus Levybacteria bacterium]